MYDNACATFSSEAAAEGVGRPCRQGDCQRVRGPARRASMLVHYRYALGRSFHSHYLMPVGYSSHQWEW